MPDAACPNPRRLPGEPTPQLPLYYENPNDHRIGPTLELSAFNADLNQPWHSQLGHLTVNAIEETADPVLTNY